MRSYETAVQIALELAEERFPEDEYTVRTHLWCDNDFRVEARQAFSETEDENTLLRVIEITPHHVVIKLEEVIQSGRGKTHESETLYNE